MTIRWPSIFSRKANPAGRVIMLGLNMTGPVHHENFTTLAHQSYNRNATVYACVSIIAQSCATVPWVIYENGATKGAKRKRISTFASYQKALLRSEDTIRYPRLKKTLDQTEITDHPLLTLLEKPNPEQTQTTYVEQLLSYLLISGNGYEHFLSPTSGDRKGIPMEMWVHRPDRIEVVRSTDPARGLVAGYQYALNGARDIFDPSAIIHHKFFNPTDDFYGMSPLKAAVHAWSTENLGCDWNYALLNNAGRTSGAVIAPTTMAEDAYERLKAEIRESYTGAKNAGTPMVLEGGMTWTPMGLTPMELDFLAGMRDAMIRTCRVFHVSPEIIGVPDAKSYASLAEARKSLWQEACLPLLDRMRDSYNHRLAPLYGDRIFVDYDRDQIDAIQEDQGKVWDKLNRTKFLSPNEKRIAAGYSSYSDPMADIPEIILNPSPGATGQPGFPAGTVSSLRSMGDFIRQAVDADETLTVEQKTEALAALDQTITAGERKAQQLTDRQKQIQAVLKRAMSHHFKSQGADLSKFLRTEISKLL